MFGNFNDETQNILVKAKLEMLDLRHPYIGTEHLVLSLLRNKNNITERLENYNLYYDNFKNEIIKIIGKGSKKSELFLYTPLLKKVIENAVIDSKENNDGEVTVEHLFSSLIEVGEGIAIRIFISMGIDLDGMYDDFSNKLIKKSNNKRNKKLLIEELGINLTEKARNNELDPVIEREKELSRLLEVLCRRTKNNPLLIGLAGVGKTAIVEELSRIIISKSAPAALLNKKIISLDMATAVAGTKYRGEFEDRMKKILKEIEDNDDIILFIDEIHTLVGAGGAEGAIDASNILKPALARGKLRCIGATTTEEYKKFIEKDKALERRFQKIVINEPSKEKTYKILSKLKPIYENYHHVKIDEKLLKELIDLSDKYIYDRSRPDKAIDILDEVCSKVSLKENKDQTEINVVKDEIERLNKEKNGYILENKFDKAYLIRKEISLLQDKLNKTELNYKNNNIKEVTAQDIASVINVKTSIPVYEILQDNINIINSIKTNLKSNIIGQDTAIENLISITKKIKLGYKDDNKTYSLLFVGPSGVGKTALSKVYGKCLVGKDNFIRLDMSEYSDAISINKIIGSPPGYIGYDDNKNILENIKDKPNSIVLLDEIDKAHPSVINLLYQILDEGKIKDSKGNIIRFDNTIIIMTSNIGYDKNSVGFNKDTEEQVTTSLKEFFSISFINRIDSIISFNKLSKKDIVKIIKNKLNKLKEKYKDINLVINNCIINEIVKLSEYNFYGARKIEKIICNKIESIVIDKIINNESDIIINELEAIFER